MLNILLIYIVESLDNFILCKKKIFLRRCIYNYTTVLRAGQRMSTQREMSLKNLWHIHAMEYYALIKKNGIELY